MEMWIGKYIGKMKGTTLRSLIEGETSYEITSTFNKTCIIFFSFKYFFL